MKARWRPIHLDDYELGRRQDFWLPLYQAASSDDVRVPFIVARGREEGPVVGVCAAVHGNELNGIKIIHSLLKELDLRRLKGSLIWLLVLQWSVLTASCKIQRTPRALPSPAC